MPSFFFILGIFILKYFQVAKLLSSNEKFFGDYQIDERNKLSFQCPENCVSCLQEKIEDLILKCQECSQNFNLLGGNGLCRKGNTLKINCD